MDPDKTVRLPLKAQESDRLEAGTSTRSAAAIAARDSGRGMPADVSALAGSAAMRCPRCGSERVVGWGKSNGLPRSRCTSCERTFNPLTNTSLARLRNRDRWRAYVGAMLEGKSVRERANVCGVDPTTAHRWQCRFLQCSTEEKAQLLLAVIGSSSSLDGLSASLDHLGPRFSACADLLPVILSWLI